MSELSLSACPICSAPGSLSRQSQEMQGQTFTWYECRDCGSVLLWMGSDKWAYQKIGRPDKAQLLKQPLAAGELQALLPATEPAHDDIPPVPPKRVELLHQEGQIESRVPEHRAEDRKLAAPKERKKGMPRLLVAAIAISVLCFCCAAVGIVAKLSPTDEATGPVAARATDTPMPTADTLLPKDTPLPTDMIVPTDTPESTDTILPTDTQEPTDAPLPTDTQEPTDTPLPTGTPQPTDTPLPTNTPRPTDTPIPPTATPDAEARARDIVRKELGESNRGLSERLSQFLYSPPAEGEVGLISVIFAINDNLTDNMIRDGAYLDICYMAQALQEAGFVDHYYHFAGTFSLVDVYGATSEEVVLKVGLTRETLERIEWETWDWQNLPIVADEFWKHPAMP